LRAYLHFHVFASDVPLPVALRPSLLSSVEISECMTSIMKLAQTAPSLKDTSLSSLLDPTDSKLLLSSSQRRPQVGIILSCTDALDPRTHHGHDGVVTSIFNQLIESGYASHVSYQRILIEWHAQEEFDYHCQGPDATATVLPFGSLQVKYLSSMSPPSPIKKDWSFSSI
jgi:hypothetical protein